MSKQKKATKAMNLAWQLRREAAERYQCQVSEISMGECLRLAWNEVAFDLDFSPEAMTKIVGNGRPVKPDYDLPAVIAKKCRDRYERVQRQHRKTGYLDGYGYTNR